MDAIILYFIQANLGIAALYLFYRLFLHRDTFFKEKRFALLVGLIFSIMYPFVDLSALILKSEPAAAFSRNLSATLPDVIITVGQSAGHTNQDYLLMIYAVIVALLFIRIIGQILSVCRLAYSGKREIEKDQTFIQVPAGTAPFSFFGWIFINRIDHSNADLHEILHHEKAHARNLHSLDVLLSELISALFWINPCVWLLKNHLRANLEYLADKDVIHSGFDQKSYQYHLLRLSYQQCPAKINNGFNVTQLKKRIIMMNKEKTSWVGLCKYALALPLFAFLLFSGNAWSEKSTLEQKSPTEIKSTGSVKEITEVTNSNEAIATKSQKTVTPDNEKALTGVEQMPEFPGGEVALMKFLSTNVHYPTSASEMGIEGRVILRFIVSKTGVVSDVEIIRGLDPACDQEAIRAIYMMPKWIPGRQNGRDVPVYFTIPIKFTLNRGAVKNQLVFIDGVESTHEAMNNIKPEDIESLSVLKDSSAVSVYGEKGKNGVIIIKKKK